MTQFIYDTFMLNLRRNTNQEIMSKEVYKPQTEQLFS